MRCVAMRCVQNAGVRDGSWGPVGGLWSLVANEILDWENVSRSS